MLHTNFACMQFNTNDLICIKMARVILAFLAKTDKGCSGENKTIGDEGITVDFSIIKVYTSN